MFESATWQPILPMNIGMYHISTISLPALAPTNFTQVNSWAPGGVVGVEGHVRFHLQCFHRRGPERAGLVPQSFVSYPQELTFGRFGRFSKFRGRVLCDRPVGHSQMDYGGVDMPRFGAPQVEVETFEDISCCNARKIIEVSVLSRWAPKWKENIFSRLVFHFE